MGLHTIPWVIAIEVLAFGIVRLQFQSGRGVLLINENLNLMGSQSHIIPWVIAMEVLSFGSVRLHFQSCLAVLISNENPNLMGFDTFIWLRALRK